MKGGVVSRSVPVPQEPPQLLFGLTEGPRALSEYAWFLAVREWLRRQGGDGEGRPVLLLPGLMADDWSTAPLRRILASSGYEPYAWGLGRNIGPTPKAIAGMDRLLLEIREAHGRPVSLIGQSLGGIFARELARRHPGVVERIITLGSPIGISDSRQSRAHQTYVRHVDQHLPEFAFDTWITAPPPAVPSTSVYSRFDGVVRWEACLHPEDDLSENIEVAASHLGLAVHPAAVYAVLDRLAAPLDPWARFERPAFLRHYFPLPSYAATA